MAINVCLCSESLKDTRGWKRVELTDRTWRLKRSAYHQPSLKWKKYDTNRAPQPTAAAHFIGELSLERVNVGKNRFAATRNGRTETAEELSLNQYRHKQVM